MTYPISDVTRRVVYSGSAGVGPYSFSFEILDQTDIAVYLNTTLLTLTSNYTVSIGGAGTGSVTLVTPATGSDTVTLVGDRAIARTTDFVTGGDLFANTLNDELDSLTIFAQQVKETADRGLKAPVTDPTDVNMQLPIKANRVGKVLAFDETTGDPVSGPSLASVTTVIAQSANINTVAGIAADVTTVAGISGNVTTVAGISSNVTTVAGVSANVTTVAGISADVTTVAGDSADIQLLADNIATISSKANAGANSDITSLSALSTPLSVGQGGTGSATLAGAGILVSGDIGVSVQGYDLDTAKTDVAQTFSASQRGTVTADNDLSFDLSVTNNFSCTPTGTGTLTFTNHTAGQSGFILLTNSSGYAISAAATTKINATDLSAISAAGTYVLSYFDNGTNTYVMVSRSFA